MQHIITTLDNIFIRLNNRRPAQITMGLAAIVIIFFGAAAYLADPGVLITKQLFRIFFHTINALLFFNLLALFTPVIVALWGAAYFSFHPSLISSIFSTTLPRHYLIQLALLLSLIISHLLMRQNKSLPVHFAKVHAILRYLALTWLLLQLPFGSLTAPALLLFLWRIALGLSQRTRIALSIITLTAAGLVVYLRDIALAVSAAPSLTTVYEFTSNLFGLHWIPATWRLARMAWLAFWLIGLVLLWLKNRHQKILAILGLLLVALSLPGSLTAQYEYLCYAAIPCYLGILVLLYEHYEHADIKKFLNVLIIPLYGALIFNACQLFLMLVR